MDNLMKHLKEAWTEIDEASKKKELTVDQMIRKINKELGNKRYPSYDPLEWVGMDDPELWGWPLGSTINPDGKPIKSIYKLLPHSPNDNESEEENEKRSKHLELWEKNLKEVLRRVIELPLYKDWVPPSGEDRSEEIEGELRKRAEEFAHKIHLSNYRSMLRSAHSPALKARAYDYRDSGPGEKLIQWAYQKLKTDLDG